MRDHHQRPHIVLNDEGAIVSVRRARGSVALRCVLRSASASPAACPLSFARPPRPASRACSARDCEQLFAEIDNLETNLEKLESVVDQLSEYSVHLEKRLTSATS